MYMMMRCFDFRDDTHAPPRAADATAMINDAGFTIGFRPQHRRQMPICFQHTRSSADFANIYDIATLAEMRHAGPMNAISLRAGRRFWAAAATRISRAAGPPNYRLYMPDGDRGRAIILSPSTAARDGWQARKVSSIQRERR